MIPIRFVFLVSILLTTYCCQCSPMAARQEMPGLSPESADFPQLPAPGTFMMRIMEMLRRWLGMGQEGVDGPGGGGGGGETFWSALVRRLIGLAGNLMQMLSNNGNPPQSGALHLSPPQTDQRNKGSATLQQRPRQPINVF